ncbi:hypothetical protein B5F37_03990 [Drancourtella sp. An210]|nr:hypothetical protein B5F37_03990 [Drancourtella sp. An210]
MKEIKEDAVRISGKAKILMAFVLLLVVLTGAFTYFHFQRRILSAVKQQADYTLQNVSKQNAKLVETRFYDLQNLLRSIAEEIGRTEKENPESIVDTLKSYVRYMEMYNMGIIDREGICYTTKGKVLDLSGQDYFKESMEGKEVVTDKRLSQGGTEEVHIFTVPVRKDGEVKMVVSAVYRASDFLRLINIQSFEGKGGSLILTEETDNGETKEGTLFRFQKGKESYMACEHNLSINNWRLLSYVQEDYLYRHTKTLEENIFVLVLLLYLLLVVISVMYMTVYQKFQKRILDIVFRDRLLGEWNYRYFRQQFNKLSREDKKDRYLVNFDVDKFKMMNLLYGKEKSDDVLRKIYQIFRNTLPEEALYRYHSDIFVAVIKGNKKEEVCCKLECFWKKVQKEMDEGRLVQCTMSFGICPLCEFGDIGIIYSNAVLAKHKAKGSITEKYSFYEDVVKEEIESKNIEMDFKEALKEKQFHVVYQPQVDMRTGMICGAEALVRWKKKDGTQVSPAKFIPVFEATGQIVELDEEVVRLVCADICEAKNQGLSMGIVSVNLSKLHIIKEGIADRISQLTKLYGVDAAELSFEITESAEKCHGKKEMDKLVDSLHQMGFQVEMDDYGTGSSTLQSLADTHFDVLKLDRSFVNLIGIRKMNIILQSTIRMAKELRMIVVAEGVETKEQACFLVRNHCFIAQGYYFYRPLSKEQYLEKRKKQTWKEHEEN